MSLEFRFYKKRIISKTKVEIASKNALVKAFSLFLKAQKNIFAHKGCLKLGKNTFIKFSDL